MSLKYKHDETQKTADKPDPAEQENIIRYDTPGKVRNIHFITLKGHQYFFNYMDLRMIDYSAETKKLCLSFISHEIQIEGNNLELIIEEFAHYLPKRIIAVDMRYNLISKEEVVINSITVSEKT